MNKLKNLKENYKKLGYKKFMERWKEGTMRITPLQLAKIEFYGLIGSIFGITASIILLFIFKFWYISFALVFSIVIHISQAIGKYQQLQILKALDRAQNVNVFDQINKSMEVKDV